MTGTLALVVGTSGSGKGALLKRAKAHHPEIVFPRSCTTRAMRPTEREGDTYHFLTPEDFQQHIDDNDFLEWAEYGGQRYGTLKSEILPALEEGKLVLREVDVQGARSIRQLIPAENLAIIYIYVGDWETLARRIQGRAPMTAEELDARKRRYEDEQIFRTEASYIVNNPDGKFKEADSAFDHIISELLAKDVSAEV